MPVVCLFCTCLGEFISSLVVMNCLAKVYILSHVNVFPVFLERRVGNRLADSVNLEM